LSSPAALGVAEAAFRDRLRRLRTARSFSSFSACALTAVASCGSSSSGQRRTITYSFDVVDPLGRARALRAISPSRANLLTALAAEPTEHIARSASREWLGMQSVPSQLPKLHMAV
jgi:hypothetical protein